jgi:hypothetical protein
MHTLSSLEHKHASLLQARTPIGLFEIEQLHMTTRSRRWLARSGTPCARFSCSGIMLDTQVLPTMISACTHISSTKKPFFLRHSHPANGSSGVDNVQGAEGAVSVYVFSRRLCVAHEKYHREVASAQQLSLTQ